MFQPQRGTSICHQHHYHHQHHGHPCSDSASEGRVQLPPPQQPPPLRPSHAPCSVSGSAGHVQLPPRDSTHACRWQQRVYVGAPCHAHQLQQIHADINPCLLKTPSPQPPTSQQTLSISRSCATLNAHVQRSQGDAKSRYLAAAPAPAAGWQGALGTSGACLLPLHSTRWCSAAHAR